MHTGTRSRLWFFRITSLAVAVAFGLVVLEGAARVRQRLRFGSSGETPYGSQFDPRINAPVPVAGERTRRIQINSLGFRGPEIPAVKAPRSIRVAFLGASTTFCAEVSGNEVTWPHMVVEEMKRRWPESAFDYVNASFPGYGVETSHRNLLTRVAPLQPDVIVIYDGHNDISLDTRMAAQRAGITREAVDERSGLSKYSLMYFLLKKNFQILRNQQSANSGRKLTFEPRTLSQRFHRELLSLVTDARRIASQVVLPTMSQKVRADQAADVQVSNASTHLYYMPQLTISGILAAFGEYNRVIGEVAAETGSVLVGDEDSIPGDSANFTDSLHFTDAGSRAMAARVSRMLLAHPSMIQLVEVQRGQSAANQGSKGSE